MSGYKKIRLTVEKEELDAKIHNLRNFMHGNEYTSLSPVDQGLLMVQLVAMDNYSDALARRIEIG